MNIFSYLKTWLAGPAPRAHNRQFIDVGFRPRDALPVFFGRYAVRGSSIFGLHKRVHELLYLLWQYSVGFIAIEDALFLLHDYAQKHFKGSILLNVQPEAGTITLHVFPGEVMPYVIEIRRGDRNLWHQQTLGLLFERSEGMVATMVDSASRCRYSHVG